MTGLWDYIALALIAVSLAGWVGLRYGQIGSIIGVGLLLVAWFLSDIWIAVFAPFGVVLPLATAMPMARQLGWTGKRLALGDLVLLAVGLAYLLFAAGGVFSWDVYRYGYDPLWGSAICVVFATLAVLRGYVPLAGAVVVAQALWIFGISTDNAWDGLSHVVLLPILGVCIIRRLFAYLRR